jgi:hypothetical protein
MYPTPSVHAVIGIILQAGVLVAMRYAAKIEDSAR